MALTDLEQTSILTSRWIMFQLLSTKRTIIVIASPCLVLPSILVYSVQFPVSKPWKYTVLVENFQWVGSCSSPTENAACLFYQSGYPSSKTHWQLRVCRHILPRAKRYLLNFLLFWMPRLWCGLSISTFLQFLFTVLMLLGRNMDFQNTFLGGKDFSTSNAKQFSFSDNQILTWELLNSLIYVTGLSLYRCFLSACNLHWLIIKIDIELLLKDWSMFSTISFYELQVSRRWRGTGQRHLLKFNRWPAALSSYSYRNPSLKHKSKSSQCFWILKFSI